MQRSQSVTLISTLVAFKKSACAAALAASLLANAMAAELGDVTVLSFSGQPLVADIALTALAPDELSGLQVRLASPDVYRGANVRIHPAMASMRMAVTQSGQRQFVHITTRQAIDADYLHLFLELIAGDRHSVRAITIWLAPAPPVAPMMPLAPLAPLAPVVKVAPVAPEAPVARSPAPRAASERTHSHRKQPAPHVESEFEQKAGAMAGPRHRESTSGPKPGPRHGAAMVEAEAERALRADQQAKESAALGIENEALREKISTLEEKVAALQRDYAARPAPAMPKIVPAAPVAVPTPAKASLLPWIAGAAVLLIASGVLGFLYRKKISASRHWISLSKRFKRKVDVPDKPRDAQ